MSFGKGYYNKLYQATNLLSIESINITTQRLEKNSKKMKVSQPIMRAAVNTSSTTTTAFLKRQASMISKDYDLLCNSKAELVLILSTILYSQTCQVMSLSSHRPNVILQVFIWQKGINFGVVCYDKIKQDIYMIQPTQVEQETITIPLQAADVEEIAINMSLYATSLTYQEEVDLAPILISIDSYLSIEYFSHHLCRLKKMGRYVVLLLLKLVKRWI